jgi:Na+/melibiose symporter-like transporter
VTTLGRDGGDASRADALLVAVPGGAIADALSKVYAIFSFTRTVGQAIGAAAASYTIGPGGYVGGVASQSDSALTASNTAAGVVPAAFTLAAIAAMSAYPLTEARFREIVREVARRSAAQQQVVP